jgi:hypothetical protein
LGEVKVDYFDPQLLSRTQQQIVGKSEAIKGYENKATTADVQVAALFEASTIKTSILR